MLSVIKVQINGIVSKHAANFVPFRKICIRQQSSVLQMAFFLEKFSWLDLRINILRCQLVSSCKWCKKQNLDDKFLEFFLFCIFTVFENLKCFTENWFSKIVDKFHSKCIFAENTDWIKNQFMKNKYGIYWYPLLFLYMKQNDTFLNFSFSTN